MSKGMMYLRSEVSTTKYLPVSHGEKSHGSNVKSDERRIFTYVSR